MKVEILFPEVCNLYGDLQNIFLQKALHSVLSPVTKYVH